MKTDLHPGRVLVLGYIIVIMTGTILLSLPTATVGDASTDPIDALFTATSATAVTGLIVVNTAEHWTLFGKLVIMALIQVGGLGFMTSTTMIFLLVGKRMSLRERLIIMEDLNYTRPAGAVRLTRNIILLTFLLEFIGALLLYLKFQGEMPLEQAWFFSVFHAISAFNNAGFDLFGNSLVNYASSVYINLIIAFLIIVGGLGFIVLTELFKQPHLKKMSLHSKMVLVITLFLIIIGTLLILLLEYNNPSTIGSLTLSNKILASFFQGVTPRTAGFNTVPIGSFKDVSLFFIIILMFIGASPGSTGGGVKTTTAGTLVMVVLNLASGKEDIDIFRRRLKQKDIYKALAVIVISLVLIALVIMILSLTEGFAFIHIVFEVFSAFGTVGLSTGITGELSTVGRLLIILTMFIGRVGPFTIALALGKKRKVQGIHYPEEEILIG